MRGQARQTLAPAAAHAQQQRVGHRLADDARDPRQVHDGVHEHHQVHLGGADLIVVLEELVDLLGDLGMVGHLAVGPVVDAARHVVAVEQRLCRHHVVELRVELDLHLVLAEVLEPVAVVVVDEAVLVDAAALVVPQPQQVSQVLSQTTLKATH